MNKARLLLLSYISPSVVVAEHLVPPAKYVSTLETVRVVTNSKELHQVGIRLISLLWFGYKVRQIWKNHSRLLSLIVADSQEDEEKDTPKDLHFT